VRGSGASTVTPADSIDALVRAWNFSRASSKVNFTSAEVKSRPSCHFTPERRVKR
jgi:hypothetical protein